MNQYKQNREQINQRKNSDKLADYNGEHGMHPHKRCHSMANKITELSDPATRDALVEKFAEIQRKVVADLTKQESPQPRSPYKLFT